jgi:hypothetical protein
MTLVQTAPPSTYVKKGGRVGRPRTIDKIVRTNTKIDEFFTASNGGQLMPYNAQPGVTEVDGTDIKGRLMVTSMTS